MARYEWDEAKATSNFRKHRIRFESARRVFDDPYALVEQDRNVDGEPRWQALGLAEGILLLLVAHTSEGEEEVVRIISARAADPKEQDAMTRIVRKGPAGPMSSVERRELEKLARRPASEIDYSDIPPLTEKFWRNAVSNPFYRPVKKQLTLRLDADVIAWLRKKGKGYQTRANELLRYAMLEDLRKKAS